MNRVPSEISEKILMFLEDGDFYALACQQVAEGYARRAATHNTTCSLKCACHSPCLRHIHSIYFFLLRTKGEKKENAMHSVSRDQLCAIASMCCIEFNCGFDVLFRRRMGSGELLMNLIDQVLREMNCSHGYSSA